MSTNPLVSVVIPTYNRAHLLGRALKSVLFQTYEHLDVIVVDDASTDNTEEVLASFRDRRLRYIRHERNKGGSAARNTGIALSEGEYIAFLDSDDEWLPYKVEKHLRVFSEDPGCGVVFSAHIEIDRHGLTRVHRDMGPEGWIYKDLLVSAVVGTTSAVVVKRECFETAGLFDETLPSCQDWDMWIRIAKNYRFRRISEPLVRYYWHGNQISTNFEAVYKGHLAILQKYKEEIMKLGSWALARHYLRLGHCLRNAGFMKEARRYYLRAMLEWPRPVPIAYFAVSLFGHAGFDKARKIKRMFAFKPLRAREG